MGVSFWDSNGSPFLGLIWEPLFGIDQGAPFWDSYGSPILGLRWKPHFGIEMEAPFWDWSIWKPHFGIDPSGSPILGLRWKPHFGIDPSGSPILGLIWKPHFGIDPSGSPILGLTSANPINTWGIQLNQWVYSWPSSCKHLTFEPPKKVSINKSKLKREINLFLEVSLWTPKTLSLCLIL